MKIFCKLVGFSLISYDETIVIELCMRVTLIWVSTSYILHKTSNWVVSTVRWSCLPNAVVIFPDLSSYPASQEERLVAPRNLLSAHTNLLLA